MINKTVSILVRKLLFVTGGQIPSNRANAIHIINLLPELDQFFTSVDLLSQIGNNDELVKCNIPSDRHYPVVIPNVRGGLFLLLLKYRNLIKKLKPDFIYSRFVLLPFISPRIPFLIEFHDDAWNKGIHFKWAVQKAIKQKNCLGFVCITHAIKNDFERTFPNIRKGVKVIEDAASLPPESYIPRFSHKTALTLAYIGSLYPGKGMEIIIPLAEAMPEHTFKIIGGNNKEIATLRSLTSAENIQFKGYIPHKEIWAEMVDVDVCLLPNQPDVHTGKVSNIGKYTSPLKMFEYMSYSKPIIASNLEVLKEVLNSDFALFVAHDNIEEWKHAVITLTDSEKRKRMGRKAFEALVNKHTWGHRAERIVDFINDQSNKIPIPK